MFLAENKCKTPIRYADCKAQISSADCQTSTKDYYEILELQTEEEDIKVKKNQPSRNEVEWRKNPPKSTIGAVST